MDLFRIQQWRPFANTLRNSYQDTNILKQISDPQIVEVIITSEAQLETKLEDAKANNSMQMRESLSLLLPIQYLHSNKNISSKKRSNLLMIPSSLFWFVWAERNKRALNSRFQG